MHLISVNGTALHILEDGDPEGPAVIFSNPLGTDLRIWRPVIARLPVTWRMIRIDMRGHGLSALSPISYDLETMINDVAAALQELQVDQAVFVGLSTGGLIAQGLAAHRPDLIRALFLTNTAAQMGSEDLWQGRISAIREGGLEAVADQVMNRWFSRAFQARPEFDLWRSMFLRTPTQGYLAACAALQGADLSDLGPQISQPVLGIAGTVDGANPPDEMRQTLARMPNAMMTELAGMGHLPNVEDPETYARLLTAFVEGLPPAKTS